MSPTHLVVSPRSLILISLCLSPAAWAADSDGDGLTDADETSIWATDPLDDDTDDDGLTDGSEATAWLTDPLSPDTDGDGLLDGLEVGLVAPQGMDTHVLVFIPDSDSGATITDPLNPDTDGDGLVDGSEDINHDGQWTATLGATGTAGWGETNPLNPDTDGDGLTDSTEVNHLSTSPLDTDTDDGGVSDGTEVLVDGTDPLVGADDGTTPDPDSDGDGVPDGQDLCPGTAPGAVVDPSGCSIDDLCPCDDPWANPGAYIGCVTATAGGFVQQGLLQPNQLGAIVSAAAQSSCGTP